MLTLSREHEVSVHGQAADLEWTLHREAANQWVMTVEAPVGPGRWDEKVKKEFRLTDAQASATLALFVGELEEDKELNAMLYDVAEAVWREVETNFRPIP